MFQFTLPCRERPWECLQASTVEGFNSRSRVGSDAEIASASCDLAFQFTLPCRERPELTRDAAATAYVSIHAPV